jgi:tungstate transport system ATP-binding protein
MSKAPIYRIQNLVHQYHSSTVLEIDELTIPKNAIIGLSGPNGSGKTTLLKMLAFIEKPSRGSIYFNERKAEPFSSRVRSQVTYLPQVPYLMKRTVLDNITYGLKIRKDQGDHKKKGYEALSMVGLSGEAFANRKWFELSGGEAQRVALAARLILKPKVLLLDEPTANVDENSSRMIRDASLRAIEKWDTTLLIASHDLDWLNDICQDIIYLFQGQLSGSGKNNILFSPFHQNPDGGWEKLIGDQQSFLITQPPLRRSAAVIPSSSMQIFPQNDLTTWKKNMVRGVLTHLRVERARNTVIAYVLVEGFQFIVDLSQEQQQDSRLYPGKEVFLSFNPQDIKWQ